MGRKGSGKWLNNQKGFKKEVEVRNPTLSLQSAYISSEELVFVKCKLCDTIYQAKASRLLSNKAKCNCSKVRPGKKTHEYFVKELQELNPNIQVIGSYIRDGVHIKVECVNCSHSWKPTPNDLLHGCGCPQCANERRSNQPHKRTHQQYLKDIKIYNPTWIPIGHYDGLESKVLHMCSECMETYQIRPEVMVRRHNLCRNCEIVKRGKIGGVFYSRQALKWLTDLEKSLGIKIRHAHHKYGEFIIPGTTFRVDGFCEETKTVYEFLGDCWHGNPFRFSSKQKCHPFTDTTAGKLYKKTFDRLVKIKSLGYRVRYIWESAYKDGRKYRVLRRHDTELKV